MLAIGGTEESHLYYVIEEVLKVTVKFALALMDKSHVHRLTTKEWAVSAHRRDMIEPLKEYMKKIC